MNKIERGVLNFDAYEKIDCPTCKWERLNHNKHACTGWCIGCDHYKEGKKVFMLAAVLATFQIQRMMKSQYLSIVFIIEIRRTKMVKVVDADKINYPYCKAWPTLLDHVPVDEAMDAGWTICSNWVSEVPEDEVRHLEDNEEEYYKIIKEYN